MNETFPPVNDIVVPAQAGVILVGQVVLCHPRSNLWSPHRRG